jgi:hypothetical protein
MYREIVSGAKQNSTHIPYISNMKNTVIVLFLLWQLVTHSQPATEIILFDVKSENNQLVFSNPVNITRHAGYDNQPFFHPAKPLIYYSSFNDDGRSDILVYNYQTGKTSPLTQTREREYSPTVTPDGKFISCIIQRDNGAQELAKYPIQGGKPVILISDQMVGYHTWITANKLALYILGDSTHPNTLHLFDLTLKYDTILAKNIGRSLQLIPGEPALSFVQNISETEKNIMKYDFTSGTISLLARTIRGQDFFTWFSNNQLLMGEGNGLYLFDTRTKQGWQPVLMEGDEAMLKGITRVAVNADKTKLAVVVTE